MSTPTLAQQVIVVEGPSPELRLTVWPLRDEPKPSWTILSLAVASSLAAGTLSQSWLMGLIALAALVIALWRLWSPVEVRMYELGITQTAFRRSWRMPWREVARYEIRHSGVLLLPDDDVSPFGKLKSLYIPWGPHREEMLALLEHYLPIAEDVVESKEGGANASE